MSINSVPALQAKAWICTLYLRVFSRWRGYALREGETEEEGRTCSFGRLEPDVSPVLLDEFATEIQAQAGPADPVGLAIGRPDKPTKEVGLLCLRDADALIPNTDEGLLSPWQQLQRHLD